MVTDMGAGTAAGIDAALHVVEQELGAQATNVIARRMLVPPRRDGVQARFIAMPAARVAQQRLTRAHGFGQAAVLRPHFSTVLGTSPSAYRRRFSLAPA